MRNRFATICLLAFLTASILPAASGGQEFSSHNYSSLRAVEIQLKDFSFDKLDGEPISLREAVKGQKLILVHYFAAWCHNSNFDVVTINELYKKYRHQGFAVIGVCEYSTASELKEFIENHQPEYPICLEGDGKKKQRTGTTHYFYRQQAHDQRLWGTPLNILVSAEDLNPTGEIVAGRAQIALGELVKTEVDELLKEKLKD